MEDKQCAYGDHPRGCGENMYITRTALGFLGSPPRMRGKRLCSLIFAAISRITPADAGKTTGLKPTHRAAQDHPRGCGENRRQELNIARGDGSPPRMRGKRHHKNDDCGLYGITPADAGKTGYLPHVQAGARDHPRGCGENCGGLRT